MVEISGSTARPASPATLSNPAAAPSNASRPGEAINTAARASFYTRGRTSNDNTSENTTLQNTKRQFESNYDGTLHNTFRVQNLDLAVTGAGTDANPAKAHLLYYDENQRQVKFRYGSIGTTGTTINPSTLGYNQGDTFTNVAPALDTTLTICLRTLS